MANPDLKSEAIMKYRKHQIAVQCGEKSGPFQIAELKHSHIADTGIEVRDRAEVMGRRRFLVWTTDRSYVCCDVM